MKNQEKKKGGAEIPPRLIEDGVSFSQILMNTLTIKRNLDESTRKQAVWRKRQDSGGIEIFSLHITEEKEVIITDYEDYSKIYAIYSLDYYNTGN